MKNAESSHVEGIFQLNEDAGSPIDDVTVLTYTVNEEQLGYARLKLPDATWLMPGASTRALLTFVQRDLILSSLEVGLKLDAYSSTRKVGTFQITGVSIPPLKPHSPAQAGDTLAIGIVYMVTTVLTAYLAGKAFAPCESDFEGGCSLGRLLMAMASLIPAAAASLLGVLVKRQLAQFLAPASPMALAHSMLWVAPLLYILTVLYLMFHG